MNKYKFKNNTFVKVSYFTSKIGLFGKSRVANQDKHAITNATGKSPTREGKGLYFMEKEEVGRGCFEPKSTGDK